MPELRIRAARVADLAEVIAVQGSAYPVAYHEPENVFSSRLEAGSDFCFVAEREGKVLAYVFAHPWQGAPPTLHVGLPVCTAPDHVFLHDLCVMPGLQGASCGSLLYRAVESACRNAGQTCLRLVALEPARGFWLRQGFALSADPLPGVSYGDAACMERFLSLDVLPA